VTGTGRTRTGRNGRRAALVALLGAPLLLAAAGTARGQATAGAGAPAGAAGSVSGGRRWERQQAGPGDAGGQGAFGRRQQLEQRLRQRLEQVVQARLHLSDDQMVRLRETNQRFAGQRRVLADREREVRQAMRAELVPGVAANQQHVSSLIDSLFVLQRQRLDVLQAEQRELAGYLTPLQRVQYYGLQERLRERLEQIRRRRQSLQQGGPGGPGDAGMQPASPGPGGQGQPGDTLSP
jgi:periplasmic protein CpxP/Spy